MLYMSRFMLLESQETALAKRQYYDSCVIVEETLTSQLNKMLDTGRLIAESYTHKYMRQSVWPNVTIEGFEMFVHAEANARAVSFNPIIYNEDRAAWEQYVVDAYH